MASPCPSLWVLYLSLQGLLYQQTVGPVELPDAVMACGILPQTNQPAQVAKWRVPVITLIWIWVKERKRCHVLQLAKSLVMSHGWFRSQGSVLSSWELESKQLRYLRWATVCNYCHLLLHPTVAFCFFLLLNGFCTGTVSLSSIKSPVPSCSWQLCNLKYAFSLGFTLLPRVRSCSHVAAKI